MDKNVIGMWTIGISIFAILILVGYASVNEQRRWDKFAVDHHCKVVGEMDSEIMTTFSSGGHIGFGSTESKTGYMCDDGVTHWR